MPHQLHAKQCDRDRYGSSNTGHAVSTKPILFLKAALFPRHATRPMTRSGWQLFPLPGRAQKSQRQKARQCPMEEPVPRVSATTEPMWQALWQGEAGILGSPGPGVAPEAGIIAIQVFSRDGDVWPGAWSSDLIKGLERVYELRNTYTIASVNMSLGGGAILRLLRQHIHLKGCYRQPACCRHCHGYCKRQ